MQVCRQAALPIDQTPAMRDTLLVATLLCAADSNDAKHCLAAALLVMQIDAQQAFLGFCYSALTGLKEQLEIFSEDRQRPASRVLLAVNNDRRHC